MTRAWGLLGISAAMALSLGITVAGVLGQAGGPQLNKAATVPGLRADGGRLPFPTVPPALSDTGNCRTYEWTFRTPGPLGGAVSRSLLGQGAHGWLSGLGTGEPDLNFDFDLPPDTAEAVVYVRFESDRGSSQYAYQLWGSTGRWHQSFPVDSDLLASATTMVVSVCWQTGPPEPDWEVVVSNADNGQLTPGGFEVWSDTSVLVMPPNTVAGSNDEPYVFRPNGGNLIPANPFRVSVGGRHDIPVFGVDGRDELLPPSATVLDAVEVEGGRTAFLVSVVTSGSVWNPAIALRGFPNGASFAFPAPKLFSPSDPLYFSLNVLTNQLGTFAISDLTASVIGGSPSASAPAGARVVYGQPGLRVNDDGNVTVVANFCNPTESAIVLANAGIDIWHTAPNGRPLAGLFGTFSGTIEPFACESTELDVATARWWRAADTREWNERAERIWRELALPGELTYAADWESTGSPAIR
ncbi:MAG: hypothetical protein ACKVVT_01675 [Dehalococcoidia bacterium]